MTTDSVKVKKGGMNWWFVVILIVGFTFLGWLISSVITYIMPKVYESRAVVELFPQQDAEKSWGVNQYMDTELEVMRSGEVMSLAAEMLQPDRKSDETVATEAEMPTLEAGWGDRYSAIKTLSQSANIQRLGKGRVLEITVGHQKKEKAQVLAKAIYQAYKDRRAGIRKSILEERAKGLKLLIMNQNDRMAEMRKRYMDILEKVGGEYSGSENIDRIRAQQELNVSKSEFEYAKIRLNRLQNDYDDARQELTIPVTLLVVHEVPSISHSPVSPDISGNQARGMLAGFLFSILIVGLMIVGKLCARRG